jgi:hypothetical protein
MKTRSRILNDLLEDFFRIRKRLDSWYGFNTIFIVITLLLILINNSHPAILLLWITTLGIGIVTSKLEEKYR